MHICDNRELRRLRNPAQDLYAFFQAGPAKASGKLPKQGFVRQEEVMLDDFLKNRFGKAYDKSMKDLTYKDANVSA